MGSQAGRYIFLQTAVALAGITVVLTAALWLAYSLRFVEYIVDDGVPLSTFGYLVLLTLPRFLGVALPIALFCAILFVYYRLLADSELIVLRASGASDLHLAAAALALAALVMAAAAAVSLVYAPAAARAFKDLQFAIRNDFAGLLLQPGVFKSVRPGVTLYVREQIDDRQFSGILIHDDRASAARATMMAERGSIVPTPAGLKIVLANGNRQHIDRDTGKVSLLYFDRYSVELDLTGDAAAPRWRDARERSLGELLGATAAELGAVNVGKFRAEGHERLASPLLPLALAAAALAALLRGEFNRRRQARRLLTAAGVGIALKAGAIAAKAAVVRVPALWPILYLLPLAAILVAFRLLIRPVRRVPLPAAAAAA